MKSFICIALIAIAIACATANPVSSSSHNQEAESEVQTPAAADELTRLRKSAYGGSSGGGYGGSSSSIPAPPCAKNYLFSCQPNLAPVPCSAPAPTASYGSQGAYSAPVPTYLTPFYGNYGAPQAYSAGYVPQGLHYFQY